MSKGEKMSGPDRTLQLEGNILARPSGLPSMPKGDIVGRFTVGSKLVIDGKNSDGKD
jgi:hypothetical protein